MSTPTTTPDDQDGFEEHEVAQEAEELLHLVAQYRRLSRVQRRSIAYQASPEVRRVLAQVERDMALTGSPGSMSAILTDGREKQARHLDLIDKVFRDIARGHARKVLITMPPRHGKQVADSEPVLTTEGWKRHGELSAGDYVYAPTGKPVQVEWVSQPSDEKVRVTFNDGESVLVHPNHEWTVYDRSSGTWRTVETRYLATQKLHSGPQGRRGGRYRFQLPPVTALQNPEADLPVDPYTLGVWLGDGTTGKASFCGTAEDVDHIAGRIPYELGARWVHPDTGVHYQYIKGLMALLRDAGVLAHKRIPQGYLLASERQRRDLLAGLVDTDGSLGSDGRIRFVSASEELARDVRDLARTLGYRANLSWRGPDERERSIWGGHPLNGGSCWVTDWTPHDGLPQGTLPRKAIKHPVKTKRRIGFAAIEPAAPEPGRCIQVEGSLYLVGRALIPTHNSRRAARWAPLWYLSRHPDHRVMIASYSADLADDHGRWIRDAINAYGPQLGIALHAGSKAANRFDLANPDTGERLEGGLVTAGVGGGLTGKGAHLAIVDDPIKDDAEAQSPTMRKRLWDWWTSVLNTRIEPGGSIIVIQTRWHEDDLAGRILAGEDAADWTILDLPAICDSPNDPLGREIGRPLWPLRYGLKALAKIRRAVGERVWGSLYQQKPRPVAGGVWQEAWIERNRISTAMLRSIDLDRIVVAVDPAGGESSVNDEVGIIAAACAEVESISDRHDRPEYRDEYFVLDDKSASLGADEWGKAACLLAVEWQADAIVVEANFGGDMTSQVIKQAWQELARRNLTKGQLMPRIIPVTAKKGKRLRAEPIAQLYDQDRVHHVGTFSRLESQMISWMVGMDSPDRMDAAVHAITELADIDGGETVYGDYDRPDPRGR